MKFELRDKIFRQYDIRGVWGEDLTPQIAEALGKAYAVYHRRVTGIERPKVTVGRDVRISSTAVRDALIKGLTSFGVDCVDIGECPTPLQYFSIHTMEVDGGVMITGSHNPPDYNGFKISVGKETIHGDDIQELRKIMHEEPEVPEGVEPGAVECVDVIPAYMDNITQNFSIEQPNPPIKVVLDAGNGTAGPVAPELMRRLGCEVVELFCEPDGTFPNHHPDPTVEHNLVALKQAIATEGADFGVGYDGDSDRIGVVDERGAVVWGDQLMVIFARDILRTTPGATVVGEVKCSQVMYDEIDKAGGNAVMWKTGHSLIKSKMKELKAAMAGEMSGHIFFADRYFGFDDAVYATVRLVEILARRRGADSGATFSGLLAGVPHTFSTPEIRVDCPDSVKFEVIEKLAAVIEGGDDLPIRDIITIDGLRIIFDEGWALVRASNTQPALVMRFEAESAEMLQSYKAFMKEKMGSVSSECVIPD